MRKCKKCEMEKTENDFSFATNNKDKNIKYRRSKCRKCYNEERKVRLREEVKLEQANIKSKICNQCAINKELKEFPFIKSTGRFQKICIKCRTICLIGLERNYRGPINPTIDGLKICTKCKLNKKIDDFRKPPDRTCLNSQCRECEKAQIKNWRITNQDHVNAVSTIYRENHRAEFREYSKKSKKKNPENVRAGARKSYHKRYSTPKGKLNTSVSSGIRKSLRGNKNGLHWEDIVGYTLIELLESINSKFSSGMTWEDYLSGEIQIDHVIPKSLFVFNYPEDEQFKLCWSLRNLQPLWWRDNLIKGDKLPDGRRVEDLKDKLPLSITEIEKLFELHEKKTPIIKSETNDFINL